MMRDCSLNSMNKKYIFIIIIIIINIIIIIISDIGIMIRVFANCLGDHLLLCKQFKPNLKTIQLSK